MGKRSSERKYEKEILRIREEFLLKDSHNTFVAILR